MVDRVATLAWRERGKLIGKLLCLHAQFKSKNCTDMSGSYRKCENLVANISTWTYPLVWIKCKAPKEVCIDHFRKIMGKVK